MNLLELQRRMAHDVRRPLTSDYQMQRITEEGDSTETLAASYIAPNASLSSFERLEIYNRQYWFRIIAAVSEDFPALNATLGAKKFNALILAYLLKMPSTSWTLRDLGAGLPRFLEEYPELAGRRHRLAADVAHLEWAYVEAFDGLQFPPLAQNDLQCLGRNSKLRLQPHLRLLELHYPVDELVLSVRKESPEMEIASNAAGAHRVIKKARLPMISKCKCYLAVHRFEDVVYYREIEPEVYVILSALQHGASIEQALSAGLNDSALAPDAKAELIQRCFAHAAELGWFCPWDTLHDDEATLCTC